MNPPRTPPTVVVPGAAGAGPLGGAGWAAVLQAQLQLLERLTLLYRHAARESQSARSPMELLSIHMNFQKALAQDCAAYAMDCMLCANGSPGEGLAGKQEGHRSLGEAVAPVLGAMTEPMIEGVQAALFAAAGAPSAAFEGPAPQAAPLAQAAQRGVDSGLHASAQRRPEPDKGRREGAPARGRGGEKPQARREPARKQARPRGRK